MTHQYVFPHGESQCQLAPRQKVAIGAEFVFLEASRLSYVFSLSRRSRLCANRFSFDLTTVNPQNYFVCLAVRKSVRQKKAPEIDEHEGKVLKTAPEKPVVSKETYGEYDEEEMEEIQKNVRRRLNRQFRLHNKIIGQGLRYEGDDEEQNEEEDEEEDENQPPMEGDALPEAQWFMVNVRNNYERRIKAEVEQEIRRFGWQQLIQKIVVPSRLVEKYQKNGKKKLSEERAFPGYLLFKMVMVEKTWKFVLERDGIKCFLGQDMGRHGRVGHIFVYPEPLDEQEVEQIMRLASTPIPALAPPVQTGLSVGDEVVVKKGPLKGFGGKVLGIKGIKVTVKLAMFGKEVEQELEVAQVEREMKRS